MGTRQISQHLMSQALRKLYSETRRLPTACDYVDDDLGQSLSSRGSMLTTLGVLESMQFLFLSLQISIEAAPRRLEPRQDCGFREWEYFTPGARDGAVPPIPLGEGLVPEHFSRKCHGHHPLARPVFESVKNEAHETTSNQKDLAGLVTRWVERPPFHQPNRLGLLHQSR